MYRNSSNAYQVYQNNQVNTASKEKLLMMLYDGAIKFLRLSIKAMKEKNIEKTNQYLIRTQDIISELMITINFDAGDIAKNLHSLYDFMNYELIQANIEKDINRVENICGMMSDLRNTWSNIIQPE